MSKFTKKAPALKEKLAEEFDTSEDAKVLYLISKTGFRIGGKGDTGAEKQAFGASTLTTDHVSVEDGKAVFDFTGKKGVQQRHVVGDPKIVAHVEAMKSEKGSGAPLFGTSPEKVRDYMHQMAPGFKVKDFRTYVATDMAIALVGNMQPPESKKDLAKSIMAVCKEVSQKLGNSPAMAKNSYIDPSVWKQWEGIHG